MEIRKGGRAPAPQQLDQAVAEAVLQERLRRSQVAATRLLVKAPSPISLERQEFFLGRLHAKQRAFVLDPSKQKACRVASRGGKTTAFMLYACYIAEQYPGAVIPYIVPESKAHAQDMFWRPMKRINHELQLGLDFKEQDKIIVFPNEAIVRLLGAHDEGSEARVRGIPFPLVLLDECKDFGPRLRVLLEEAIIPRLDDYDGTVVCGGTPGSVLDGMFYDITRNDGLGLTKWTVHAWDRQDNHHLPEEARDVYAIAKKRGIDPSSPYFRREYLGEWAPDEAELAYPYLEARNGWHGSLAHGIEWNYIIAADFGEKDASAWVVCAFAIGDPSLYFVEYYAQKGMVVDQMARKSMEFYNKYKALGNVVSIRGDSGGLGRTAVTLLNVRYGCPMQPVEKSPGYKAAAIENMRSDFILGRIKAAPGTALTKEWARINKDPKTGLTDHTDLGDAALYAHVDAQHWLTPTGENESKPLTSDQVSENHDITNFINSRKQEWWGGALSEA